MNCERFQFIPGMGLQNRADVMESESEKYIGFIATRPAGRILRVPNRKIRGHQPDHSRDKDFANKGEIKIKASFGLPGERPLYHWGIDLRRTNLTIELGNDLGIMTSFTLGH